MKNTLPYSGFLRRFFSNKRGNIALTTALMIIPVFGAAGLALDYSNLIRVRTDMQAAADAAALAAAKDGSNQSDEAMQKTVSNFFKANDQSFQVFNGSNVNGSMTSSYVEVKATDEVPLYLMGIFGKKRSAVEVISRATLSQNPVEMAIVLDNTYSMSYGSWGQVSDAMADVLEVIENNTAANSFHVTLVPFTDRVNITKERQDWLKYQDSLETWEGCVEPSEVSIANYPYALDFNATPGDLVPGVPKYWQGSFARGPEKSECAEPIVGPTTNIDLAKAELKKLSPKRATGRFDDALTWGWRAVTAQWKGRWNSDPNYPSDKTDRKKIVALFTDGKTNINKYEMERKPGEFGNNNGSITLFSHFKRVCDYIKEDDVSVFIFDTAQNNHAESYFRDCAGENYYKVQGTQQLLTAIQNLGTDTGTLRLSR